MSFEATPPDGSSAAAVPDRTERNLRMLDELAELSMTLARSVAQLAVSVAAAAAAQAAAAAAAVAPVPAAPADAAPPPAAPPQATAEPSVMPLLGRKDLSLPYSRYAKAVRQCILLQAKLEADRKRDAQPERRARDRGAGRDKAGGKTARRKKEVKRLLESSLVTEGGEDAREDALREALERLDCMEFAEDDDRPVGHIVEEICNALGVGFDGRQWTDEELGLGWPGWPDEFAEFRDAGPPPMPPRGGFDKTADGSGGKPGTVKPAAAAEGGGAAGKPAAAPGRPASFWGDDPPPFSLKDQISRDCGLTGDDGEAPPAIDPSPD